MSNNQSLQTKLSNRCLPGWISQKNAELILDIGANIFKAASRKPDFPKAVVFGKSKRWKLSEILALCNAQRIITDGKTKEACVLDASNMAAYLNISTFSLKQQLKNPAFPKPFDLGKRYWKAADIDRYCDELRFKDTNRNNIF